MNTRVHILVVKSSRGRVQVFYSPEPLHGWWGLFALSRALFAALALRHVVGVAHVEAGGAAGVVLLKEYMALSQSPIWSSISN